MPYPRLINTLEDYNNISNDLVCAGIKESPIKIFTVSEDILTYQFITEKIISSDVKHISISYKLSEAFIEQFIYKLSYMFIQHQSMSESFIIKHVIPILNNTNSFWFNLLHNSNIKLSDAFLNQYSEFIPSHSRLKYINDINSLTNLSDDDIKLLQYNHNVPEDFLIEHQSIISFNELVVDRKLSEPFLIKYNDRMGWSYISIYQTLSESFIEQYKDKVDWYLISKHQTLSESFIIKHQSKLDFNMLCTYQTLSESFIIKYIYKINIYLLFLYGKDYGISKFIVDDNAYKFKFEIDKIAYEFNK